MEKSLQETIQESLNNNKRLKLGNEDLFDSPQVSHEDIQNAMQQIGDIYNTLKQIESDMRRAKKQGKDGLDSNGKPTAIKIGDRMSCTMYGKPYEATVVDFAWDEERQNVIPIGVTGPNKQLVIPQIKTMWYKIID